MKSRNRFVQGLIFSAAATMALTTSTWAGEDSSGQAVYHASRVVRHRETVYIRDRQFDRHYYWPPLTFRGGWYALNYPYYWGYGPAVGYYDPYDSNGNYFPYPLPRH